VQPAGVLVRPLTAGHPYRPSLRFRPSVRRTRRISITNFGLEHALEERMTEGSRQMSRLHLIVMVAAYAAGLPSVAAAQDHWLRESRP